MRASAFVSAISLAALSAPEAAAAPQRVASLNLCTDELLLLLAEPKQILSVTHLGQTAAETPLWRSALRYRRNDGSLLSVAEWRPDLVLTMGGGGRDPARLARRLGIGIVDLPYPTRLADIKTAVTTVAGALGRVERGRRIVAAIARLEAGAPAAAADAVWLGGGGRSVAPTGLAAEWMRLAGLRQRPLAGDRIGLEQLLVRPPAVLVRSDYRAGQYSGEQRWLAHPLAAHARPGRSVTTDGRLWTCMGPLIVGEIVRLRAALR
jgi:iron complex transport system substrate-binding protein